MMCSMRVNIFFLFAFLYFLREYLQRVKDSMERSMVLKSWGTDLIWNFVIKIFQSFSLSLSFSFSLFLPPLSLYIYVCVCVCEENKKQINPKVMNVIIVNIYNQKLPTADIVEIDIFYINFNYSLSFL